MFGFSSLIVTMLVLPLLYFIITFWLPKRGSLQRFSLLCLVFLVSLALRAWLNYRISFDPSHVTFLLSIVGALLVGVIPFFLIIRFPKYLTVYIGILVLSILVSPGFRGDMSRIVFDRDVTHLIFALSQYFLLALCSCIAIRLGLRARKALQEKYPEEYRV